MMGPDFSYSHQALFRLAALSLPLLRSPSTLYDILRPR